MNDTPGASSSRPRLLVTTDAVGGVWQYTIDLVGLLPALGIDPVIALLGPPPGDAQRAMLPTGISFIETGLPLDWLCDDPAPILDAGAAIARLSAAHGCDLVQLNMPSLAAGGDFAVPVVAVNHGCAASWWQAAFGQPLPPERAWQAALTGAGLARATCIVAPTTAYAEVTARTYDLPHTPHVVHNGRSPLAHGESVAMADFAFTAGRLWDQVKNAALLDRVAARLAVPFHAAGPADGPNGQSFVPRHLKACGYLGEAALAETLARRPVFVSAAMFEPFGLSVLEAAAAGCALVLSDLPGFYELWDGAATFVPVDDEAGFVEAIATLIADKDLRVSLGEAARSRASRYTADATAAAMATIYRDLVPGLRAAA